MTTNQQLQAIGQILNQGYGMPSAAGAGVSRPNEMFSTIAQPTSMMGQLQSIAGPMFAQAAGMNGIQIAPHANPNQGVGEAWYAQHRNNAQWQMMQDAYMRNAAGGVGRLAGDIGINMGLHKTMGMSAQDFIAMTEGRARSGAGQFVTQQLMGSDAMTGIMGGNPMQMFQTMFANRHSFGLPGNMQSLPFNARQQNAITGVTTDLATTLADAIRGNAGGAVGMAQNMGFTRGFRDEQIGDLAVRMQQSGRFGGITTGMVMARESGDTIASKQYAGRFKGEIGDMIKSFEALGDLTGDRGDMGKLMETMSQLTQGQWERMDPSEITRGIRNIQGLATVLGKSKDEMLQAVASMQANIGGGMGITANARAAGITGGGYTSLEAATQMTGDIYEIARRGGDTSAAGIQRVTQQQTALNAIGMQSGAGKGMRALAYAESQGMVSPAVAGELMRQLASGSGATRTAAVDEVARLVGGSEARGREMMRDDKMMAYMAENTNSAAAANAMSGMRQGRAAEHVNEAEAASDRAIRRGVKDMNKLTGRRYASDPTKTSEAKRDAVLEYMRKNGGGDGADVAQQAYENAIKDGMSPQAAFDAMQSRIRGMKDMLPVNMVEEVGKIALRTQNKADVGALSENGRDSLTATSILKGITQTGADKNFSPQQQAEVARIRELATTDPKAAAKAAQDFLGSGAVGKSEEQLIRKGMEKDRARYDAQEAAMTGKVNANTRAQNGLRAGFTMEEIRSAGKQVSSNLGTISQLMEKDPEAGRKALEEYQKMVDNTDIATIASPEEVNRIKGLKTQEDVKREINRQNRTRAEQDKAVMEAESRLGVPLELSRAVGEGVLEEGITSDPKRLRERRDRRAMMQSIGAFNQDMADADPYARSTIGQMAIALGAGYTDLATVMGVTGDSPVARNKQAQKLAKDMAGDIGLDKYNKQLSGLKDRDAAAMADYDSIVSGEKNPETRRQLQQDDGDFSQALAMGQIKTEADLNKFLESHPAAAAAGAGKSMQERLKVRNEREGANKAFGKKYSTYMEGKGGAKKAKLDEITAKESRKDRIARSDAMDSLGERKHKDGTTFLSDIYEKDYADMSWSDQAKFRKRVFEISGKKQTIGLIDRFRLGGAVDAASKVAGSDEELGKLSTDKLMAVDKASKIAMKVADEKAAKGSGSAGVMKISGQLTLIDPDKGSRTVNVSAKGI